MSRTGIEPICLWHRVVPGAAARGASIIGARRIRGVSAMVTRAVSAMVTRGVSAMVTRGVSPMKVFVLLGPGLGAGPRRLRHHQEVALARVVNLAGLDQRSQRLVDQVDEVLGDGDLRVVGVEPGHDVFHVGHRPGHLQP